MLAHRTFLLCLTIVVLVISDAKWIKKNTKKSGQASVNKNFKWPEEPTDTCDPEPTKDYDYESDSGNHYAIPTSLDCGLRRTAQRSKRSAETKLQRKLTNFKEYIDDLLETFRKVRESRRVKFSGKLEKNEGTRIVGGTPVTPGTWPWLVAIGQYGQYHNLPYCGSSIINDQWLLTAAHCFTDQEPVCEYSIRAGATDWKEDPEGHAQDRQVVGIYRHPKYDHITRVHDIALLKLDEPLILNPQSSVNAICLPSTGRSVPIGTDLFAAGWGLHKENVSNGNYYIANEVRLPLIGYNTEPCGEYGIPEPGMVCAGYTNEGKDTCQGDSGGPLIYLKDGIRFQLGVTSFGKGCATKGYPGIYTDVGQYLDWIGSCIRRNS